MEWFCNCKLGNEDCKISNTSFSVFFTFWIVSYAGWTVGFQGSTAGEAMVMSSAEEELASRWRERGVMWAPVKLWRHRRLEECAILLSRAAKERRHESWAAEREERLCGVELTVWVTTLDQEPSIESSQQVDVRNLVKFNCRPRFVSALFLLYFWRHFLVVTLRLFVNY